MKSLRIPIQILIVLMILAAGLGIAVLLIKSKPEAEKKPVVRSLPAVEVIVAQQSSPQVIVKAQGEFFPPRETTLSASVGGEIIHVSDKYEVGESFKKGEVILKIDEVDFKTALVSAQTTERQILASIKDAEVALQLEQARAKQALRDWGKLGRGKEPSDLLLRKPQIAAAEARILSATASMDQARANIEQAQRNLDRTVVKAPYDCQLSVKSLDLGALATAGSPLCAVFERGSVKARVPVSVEDAGFVDIEESEIIASATLGGVRKSWEGRLERSENRINKSTRSIMMNAKFEGDEMPPVGLVADFEIIGEKMEKVFLIPRVALLGQNRVIVINTEDEISFREVTLVRTESKSVFIKEGLKDGDRVCVTVLNTPVEGSQVQVIQSEE